MSKIGKDNPNHSSHIVHQDRLVIVTRTGRRGKRFSMSDISIPLTREEVREYVTKGAIPAIKLIRANRNFDPRQALNLLNSARYHTNQYKPY